MITVADIQYVTATEAPERLGADVSPDMVYKWKKRRLVTGYRVGREVFYRLTELIEVEFDTRSRSGGRPRRAT